MRHAQIGIFPLLHQVMPVFILITPDGDPAVVIAEGGIDTTHFSAKKSKPYKSGSSKPACH